MYNVAVDGSWNEINKSMGIGTVLRDYYGHWIYGVSMSFGYANAFLAEILAVKIGLCHS